VTLKDMLKAKGLGGAPAASAPAANAAAPAAAVSPSRGITNLFNGMGDAKPSFAANYLREGHYVARIDRLKADQNRKKRTFLAIEMTVLFVLNNGEGRGHRAGESCTHMLMADQDSFLGNVKAFVSNVLGCTPEEVTEEACVDLCADDQPMRGTLIEVIGVPIVTRQGKPFTRVNYKREVPASELIEVIDTKVKAIQFPGQLLENMVEIEKKAATPEEGAAA